MQRAGIARNPAWLRHLRAATRFIHKRRASPLGAPAIARRYGASAYKTLIERHFSTGHLLGGKAKHVARTKLKLTLDKLCTSLSTENVENFSRPQRRHRVLSPVQKEPAHR
jgi:hypothetical protein